MEPVREELIRLGRPTQTIIGEDIKFVEYNWRIDRPYVDQLRRAHKNSEKSLYEVISKVFDGNGKKEFRTIFFIHENLMVLVHLFNKKTRKTPRHEIEISWQRMKNWMKEQNEGSNEKK